MSSFKELLVEHQLLEDFQQSFNELMVTAKPNPDYEADVKGTDTNVKEELCQRMANLYQAIYQHHEVEGNLALSRKKCLDDIRRFNLKYLTAFLDGFWARPYYAAEQDAQDAASYYQNIGYCEGPTYDNLNQLLSSTYQRGDRRVGLWALVDRHPDGTLKCAYSGEVIETNLCQRLMKADEEHLVPQSWHRGSKTHPGRDMHQIFIVSKSGNGSRGNLVFGDIQGVTPTHKVGGLVYKGKAKDATSTAKSHKRFKPHHNLGAVCRATLYTLVAYRDTFLTSYFPPSQLKWIKAKAMSEPVSLWERHRNAELFRLQKNRNPFIDHPGWIPRIDFSPTFRMTDEES